MQTLKLKSVLFGSPLDENFFFQWLKSLDCIKSFDIVGTTTVLAVESPTLEEAREIVSLFDRYDLDFAQLDQLINDENRAIFTDEAAGWDSKELDPNWDPSG